MVAMSRVDGHIQAEAPRLIRCPFCGEQESYDPDLLSAHFEVVAIKPLRVTPRCQPDVVVRWTAIVLTDALVAALRSPRPHS